MNSNINENYIQTDFSDILMDPQIKENNFASIIKLYKDLSKNNLPSGTKNTKQKNIVNAETNTYQNINQKDNENALESEDLLEDKSKIVEISENGTVNIKNNIFLQNKNDNANFKLENNDILNFDDQAENIFLSNNYSSSKKAQNIKNENNIGFILEDIPININNDNIENKWKKLYLLCKEKNIHANKKNIFNFLENLINFKKFNNQNSKIETEEINNKKNNKVKNVKSRNENNNDEIRNSNNTQSIRDSTDSRMSYDNLTNIITTTQINKLSNSTDFKNTINNINININNSKLIIPPISKYSDEGENLSSSRRKNNYQATNISKTLNIDNLILNSDKFKNMIDFLLYKDNLFFNNLNVNDSANVRISLDSEVKKKEYNIYTINEEENESYDSLSIQKSIKKSDKITPNKIEFKKSSFKELEDSFKNLNSINNNLSNIFNNNDDYNNKMIEKINLGENEENAKKNMNNNKEKKIMTIDLDLNSNKNSENNIKFSDDNIEMEISDNENIDEKKEIKNYTTPESKEKTIDKIYESVKINGNKKQEPKEFIIESNKLKFSDFNNIMNSIDENEENKNSEKNKEINNNEENQDSDKNLEDIETFKKTNINRKNNKEKISINPNIKNSLEDNNIFDSGSNFHSTLSNNKINENMLKEFFTYSINEDRHNAIIFSKDKNALNNKIYSIPLDSYIYILQLCFKKKLSISKKYEKFMKKLINILGKNKYNEINPNQINEVENDKIIDEKIKDLEMNLKYFKKIYIDLIIKKRNSKSKIGKEKLKEDITIAEKEENIKKIFNNLISLINNNGNKNNIWIQKIKDILNRYNQINKEEINDAKNKENKNKFNLSEKKNIANNNNLLVNVNNNENRNFLMMTTLFIPLLYIIKYFVRYSK